MNTEPKTFLTTEGLISQLRNVSLRDAPSVRPYENARITIERLRPSSLLPIAKYVMEDNLSRLKLLKSRLSRCGIDIFEMDTAISWSESGEEIRLAPSVIERSHEGDIVADGLHRIWLARDEQREFVTCAVISDASLPLIATPVDWDSVHLITDMLAMQRKRRYRFHSRSQLQNVLDDRQIKVTAPQDGWQYFLFRDFAFLGSSGQRPSATTTQEGSPQMKQNLEDRIRNEISGLIKSPSHDFNHLDRVCEYADELAKVHGLSDKKRELLRVAALLHDLGRDDPDHRHGIASIKASQERASKILADHSVPNDEVQAVLEIIDSHDQPGRTPDTLEGKILKEADFLAGFGAWGILRIALWSGETGRGFSQTLDRITEGMQRRFDSLELSGSQLAAKREMLFTKLFLAELNRSIELAPDHGAAGEYIIVDGISGAGKDTVVLEIKKALESSGRIVVTLNEPGSVYRDLRKNLKLTGKVLKTDSQLAQALLMVDRAMACSQTIQPALQAGKTVISVRSYLSTAIYQSKDYAEAYKIMHSYDWMPRCNHLVLLDLDPEAALERVITRDKDRGVFETLEDLRSHRDRYLELSSFFPANSVTVIDASQPLQEVTSLVLKAIKVTT